MPLIAPQVRQDRQPVTHKLDIRLVTLLKHYAEFIASSPDLIALGVSEEIHRRRTGLRHPAAS